MGAKLNALAAASLILVAQFAAAAAPPEPDAFEVTRRIAATGAIDLALERIGQLQGEPSSPEWTEWELLRLELLQRRGRDADVLKRIGAARNLALPDRAAARLWLTAARSALRLGQASEARDFYMRYFLRSHALPNEYRDARFAVIDTYIRADRAEDAYRSMLRFQQDFSPLRAEEVDRFVAALVGAGKTSEAVNWLPQLDKASPAAAMLRMRAGLLSPETAAAQARALIAKGVGEPAFALLADVALVQNNRALQVEAQEHRLNLARAEPGEILVRLAAALWKLYDDTGRQAANQAHLLVGDDAGWIERGARMTAQQPQLARSLLGHVAASGRTEEGRARAQLQLIASLRDAKLALTALRLFSDAQRFPPPSLAASVRYELGALALEHRHAAEAVRYWQGVAQPPGLSVAEWRLRYASALFAAGMADPGLEVVKSLVATRPLPAEIVTRLIAVAADTLEALHVQAADALFAALLPLAHGAERINVQLGVAKSRELLGDFRAAADAYLSVAALYAAPEADRESLRARELGALNLAKAGLRDDARATYQWLATNAKDPAIRESATRTLRNWQ